MTNAEVPCVIGLGANLAQPVAQLHQALQLLTTNSNITQLICSSFYASKPMGPQDQPDYVNAVASFATTLEPLALLDLLQAVENEQGRVRERHWGPRTLDLDLLFYGSQSIHEPRLVVPHPGILEREFVVIPLAEILPEQPLPNGRIAQDYAAEIPRRGLQILQPVPAL
ncbi:MAG: 2-amino-4-hydroxy-6-hydroxymethyldihydropteridine diphosphokinase [Idiomarina sp.]|nr:2-amino-4-hydroxy-6-hydroxymethyldihydropteridine diphosphokinase [Idiomarina sp.]